MICVICGHVTPRSVIENPHCTVYNHIVKISEIGEFGLIELIRGWSGRLPTPHALIEGIGDDAAAWRMGNEVMLATTDTLVEGVHFLPGPAVDLGWKAMAANLSDVAAMGGWPQVALVSLALPPSTEIAWVKELYDGLLAAAGEYGVALVGGDTVSSSQAVITVTLLGSARETDQLMRRSAALPGDLLAVTGYLGNAEAGLRVLKGLVRPPDEARNLLLEAHLRPRPRVEEGQTLAGLGVRAAIDISDGLLADAGHICEESGVSVTIEAARLPIQSYLRDAFPSDYLAIAATGGEDYELLFAAPEAVIEQARQAISTPITTIGRVERGHADQVVFLGEDGKPIEFGEAGWEHFRGAS